jgi:histone deacetylase complex regulatory component SIN3
MTGDPPIVEAGENTALKVREKVEVIFKDEPDLLEEFDALVTRKVTRTSDDDENKAKDGSESMPEERSN